MCKSNGDETGDVDFLPWRTAYFEWWGQNTHWRRLEDEIR